MNKKPVLVVLTLVLVLAIFMGFMVTMPQVTTSPVAQGEVKLEVSGGAPVVGSSTEGHVSLIVV